MAKYLEHFQSSFTKIQDRFPQFMIEHRETVCLIIHEVHIWFDKFCDQPGYNTVNTCYYHREVRHHLTGIAQITEELVQKYGEDYREIIRLVAEDHVLLDFGEIPDQSEVTRFYLRQKRGY